MILVTRHNEWPFEMTAELIQFLESLPGDVTFVNTFGEVLVRPDRQRRGTTRTVNSAGARTQPPGTAPQIPE
jgi:hypothetical protein